MDIHGPIEMYAFLASAGLVDKDPTLRRLVDCVLDMSNCACQKREDKIKKHQLCNKIYVESVRYIVPKLKNEFLNKTTERQIIFYSESGELLIIISR